MTTRAQRQRPDGSWTFATEAHDAKWYWPVGTVASFRGEQGIITKENTVSVRLRFADGREVMVSMSALSRGEAL